MGGGGAANNRLNFREPKQVTLQWDPDLYELALQGNHYSWDKTAALNHSMNILAHDSYLHRLFLLRMHVLDFLDR